MEYESMRSCNQKGILSRSGGLEMRRFPAEGSRTKVYWAGLELLAVVDGNLHARDLTRQLIVVTCS